MAQEKVEFPLAGKVTTVNITMGDTVNEGDILCLLESMKMENPILAPLAGKVIEVKATAGVVVEAGDLVVIIEY